MAVTCAACSGQRTRKTAADAKREMPIILGVTGHRDLAAAHIPLLRDKVREILQSLRAFLPSLRLACALAEGADQLVAEVAESLNIPLLVILPMDRQTYLRDMPQAAVDKLNHLLESAELHAELPPVQTGHDPKDQFEQLGLLLARRSHILLTLWDGVEEWDALTQQQRQEHRGGTAHVVYIRQSSDDPDGIGARSDLFPNDMSRLDPERSGPILHLVTPRILHEAAPEPMPPGLLRLWRQDNQSENGGHWTIHSQPQCKDFCFLQAIEDLNDRLAGISGDRVLAQAALLRPPGVPEPSVGNVAKGLEVLQHLQARVDLAAQKQQAWVVGRWYHVGRGHVAMALPGAILVFAVIVPTLTVLLEWYAAGTRLPFILIYLALFTIALAVGWWLEKQEFQLNFQDYRALAEALRVQLFWAIAGVREAASDSYLRKQRDELGWLRDALHGPALWALSVAGALELPQQNYVLGGWIESQRDFFLGSPDRPGRAKVNKRRYDLCDWAIFIAIRLALAMPIVILLLRVTHHEALRKYAVATAALFPAIAVGLRYYSEKFAFEEHAHSYLRMGKVFDAAARRLRYRQDKDHFQAVVKELGREALDENAEWLKYHRKRKISAVSD